MILGFCLFVYEIFFVFYFVLLFINPMLLLSSFIYMTCVQLRWSLNSAISFA